MWNMRGLFLLFRKKNVSFFRKRLKQDGFSLPVICKRENKSYRKDRKMMKHQVIINVVKENGEKSPVVKGAI